MPFFNDLGAALSSTGKDVAQKAKNLAEATRLNGQVAQKESKIQTLYASIGKQYFDANHGTPDDPFAGEMEQIQSELNAILELHSQLLRLRGVAVCAHCGAEIPTGSAFCPGCGKPVEATASAPAASAQAVCRACGAPLPAGALYCRNCGASQGNTPE